MPDVSSAADALPQSAPGGIRRRNAVVFLLVFLTSVVITFLYPETFCSTAQIMVEHSHSASALESPGGSYDPYLLQTDLRVIQSPVVLGKEGSLLGLITGGLSAGFVAGLKGNRSVQ